MKGLVRWAALVPVVLTVAYVKFMKRRRRHLGLVAQDKLDSLARDSWETAEYRSSGVDYSMNFLAPNALCDFRVSTFSTKEPETLDWIDKFGGDGALYDIGANVGLYSVYYAKRHPGVVFAFEPSVFNLSLLAKNIAANGVGDKVTIVPLPLTQDEQVALFRLTSTELGGAMSTFGIDIGFDGKPLNAAFEYSTVGLSLDFLFAQGIIPAPPTMIKIDVDGIEHLVLAGADAVLDSPTLRTVLVEVNLNLAEVTQSIASRLSLHGFQLTETRHGEAFQGTRLESVGNQIWVRPAN